MSTYSAIRLNTSIERGPRLDPVQRFVLTSGVPVRSITVSRSLSSRPFCSCSAFRGRARERRRLEERERGADGFRADHADRRVDRAFRADDDRRARRAAARRPARGDRRLTASSLKPKSMTHGVPSVSTKRLARRRSRCAMRSAAASRPAPRCRAATRRSTAPERGRATRLRPFRTRAAARRARRSRRSAGAACERRRHAPSARAAPRARPSGASVENGRSSPTFFRTRYR